jgi:2-hydroxy-3-oxopropionate reductase
MSCVSTAAEKMREQIKRINSGKTGNANRFGYGRKVKEEMSRIGFIGLGIMGRPMSKNLIKAGHDLVVLDIDKAATEELKEAGAEVGTSPRDVAAKSRIIITMLPNSADVKAVVLGNDGVIEGAQRGSLVVDMSSIAPQASREISYALAQKGIRMLDAPVSGGEPKAVDGTLSIMAGGAQADFDETLPIFRTIGSSAVLTGGSGAGSVTKLANQIIVQLNIAAVSEALVLVTKAGVDPELVYKAIRGGLAGSAVLDAKAPLMLDRNFKPGGPIRINAKDIGNVLETSHELGVPLPLTAAVMEILQALKADGMTELDHGAIVRYYEKLAHVEVKRLSDSSPDARQD